MLVKPSISKAVYFNAVAAWPKRGGWVKEQIEMETTPQIDFQGMEPSEAMRSRVMRHILRLEDHYGRMTACRVAIRAPSARHRTGGLYEIDIFLSLPDGRNASVGHTRQDD